MESVWEVDVAKQLDSLGVRWLYEPEKLEYLKRVNNVYNMEWEELEYVYTKHIYTPDFYCYDFEKYVEAKGWFKGIHRTKHRWFKRTHPDIEVCIVFQYDGWLTKDKKTRYSEWCIQQGIPYSVGEVNSGWFK